MSQERMAELEQKIAEFDELISEAENSDGALTPLGLDVLEARRAYVSRWRSELSRLRNEGGGGEGRCEICGWPYAESREKGCVPGDCSYRPTEGSEEARRIERNKQRIAASPFHLPAREAIERMAREIILLCLPGVEIDKKRFADLMDKAIAALQPLSQGNSEAVAWKPDADMRAELDRSELVARALLKEIMKQIDYIESEGHIEWFKRIRLDGELYLPDLAAAALAALYAAPPSQPEGVRETLEDAIEAASVLDFARAVLHGDDEHRAWLLEAAQAFIDGNPLPAPRGKGTAPTPSPGLVEAAEWHDRMADAIPACYPYEKVAWHRDCAKALRTLSAKGGAG